MRPQAIPGAGSRCRWDDASSESRRRQGGRPQVQARLAATELHCSVGIGDTKVRAKIATEFGKPRGIFRLTRENWFAVMGEKPTKELWGIGNRIQQRLAAIGIHTVRELAMSPDEPLIAAFGPNTGPQSAARQGVRSAPWTTAPGSPASPVGRDLQQNLTP